MTTRQPSSRFDALTPLLGSWSFEITNAGPPLVRGSATISPIEQGAFVRFEQAADPWLPTTPQVWKDNSPFPIVALIGADDPSGAFVYAYSDGRGVRRIYHMTMADGLWRTWGIAGPNFYQRLEGRLSQDGRTIDGAATRSEDKVNWQLDFNICYRKRR